MISARFLSRVSWEGDPPDSSSYFDVGGDDGTIIIAPEPPGEHDGDPRSRCLSLSEGDDEQGIMGLAGRVEEVEVEEGAERDNANPAISGAEQPGSEPEISVSRAGRPEAEPMPVCAEHSRSDSSDWCFERDPESPKFWPTVPSPNVNSRKPRSTEEGGEEGGGVSPMGRIDELGDGEGAQQAEKDEAHQWLSEGAQQAEKDEAHLQGSHRKEGQGVYADDAKDVTEAGLNTEADAVTEAGLNIEADAAEMEDASDVVGGMDPDEAVGVTEADDEGRVLEGDWEGGVDVAPGDDWGDFGEAGERVGSREGSDGGEKAETVEGGGGGEGGLGAREGDDDWRRVEGGGDGAIFGEGVAGGVDDVEGERTGEEGFGGGVEIGGGAGGDDDDWGDFGGGDFGGGETGFESAAAISGVAVAQGDDEWGDFGSGGDDGGAFGEFEGAHVEGSTPVIFNQGDDEDNFGDFGDQGAALSAPQSDTAAATTEQAKGQMMGTPNRSMFGPEPDAYDGHLDAGQSLRRAIQSAFGVGVDAVKSPGGRDAAARSPPKDAGVDDDEFGDFEEPCDVVMKGSCEMMGMEGEGCADPCIEWAELMRGSTGGGDYKQWRKSIGQQVPPNLEPYTSTSQTQTPNQIKYRPDERTRRRQAKTSLNPSYSEFQTSTTTDRRGDHWPHSTLKAQP